MRRSLFCFLFTIWCGLLSAQGPPDLRCLAVQEDGSVVLFWIPPDDPGGDFQEYLVGISQNKTGPYNESSIADRIVDTDTNFNPDISGSTEYYYVKAIFDDGSGPVEFSSETLEVIMPAIVNRTDTTAEVEWDPQIAPNLPTNSGEYEVFRRFGNTGPWTLRGTTPYGDEEFFDDGFKVCEQLIQYKVETEDNSGCRSVSKPAEAVFEDVYPPDIPSIDSVTIDTATGHIHISWGGSTAPDTRGYQILYWDQGWIVIDSVFGRNNTTYIDSLASGFTQAQQYTIAAFDSCIRGTPPSANVSPGSLPAHRSIFVEADPDFCESRVELEWSVYEGWGNIETYEIYYNVNGGPFAQLTVVGGGDSAYVHENVDTRQDLCYVVVGTDQNRSKTTTSNKACPTGAGSFLPSVHYITRATVVNSDYAEVTCLIDSTVPADYYALERAVDSSGTFIEVDRIDFDGTSELNFEDHTAKVNQTDYWYQVVMYDSCEFPAAVSNKTKTIYIDGSMDRDFYDVEVHWTPYIGWGMMGFDDLERYELYRITDLSGVDDGPAATFSPVEFSYGELVEEYMNEGHEICYMVRAVNAAEVESNSNRVCLGDNTKIFIPNAFRPDGQHNPEFKPVISFGDFSRYEMLIFNRFGNLIFESHDIEQGWNGEQKDGKFAQPGIYIYKITVGNQTGDEEVRTGSVLLMR